MFAIFFLFKAFNAFIKFTFDHICWQDFFPLFWRLIEFVFQQKNRVNQRLVMEMTIQIYFDLVHRKDGIDNLPVEFVAVQDPNLAV